jgi:gluconate 2-dehydrogenase gamma chain
MLILGGVSFATTRFRLPREPNGEKTRTAVSGMAEWFDAHGRRTIEAAMARIIPTDADPGAREAGTVDFVDRYLCGVDFIWARPDGSGFVALHGKHRDVWQRRIDDDRQAYAAGIAELDRQSHERFGNDFLELDDTRQDEILRALEGDEHLRQPMDGIDEITEFVHWPAQPLARSDENDDPRAAAAAFFKLLVQHTRQGFYSDPIYGGNRDHVGWRIIGFHGPRSLAQAHSGQYSSLPYFATLGPETQSA